MSNIQTQGHQTQSHDHHTHCLSMSSNPNPIPPDSCTVHTTADWLLSPKAMETWQETAQEPGTPRGQCPHPSGNPPMSPVPRPMAPSLPQRAEQEHRLHLWETGTQRAERESIYSGENIFVLRVKGSHFQQFNALFAGPGAGVAARGLFFEAERHIMRLLTAAPCHPAKNQNGYLSINLTLHPLHFICLNKFGG